MPPLPRNLFLETVSILKRPRTPTATPGMVDYQNPDHEQLMKRLRPAHPVEEVLDNFLSNLLSIRKLIKLMLLLPLSCAGFAGFIIPDNSCC